MPDDAKGPEATLDDLRRENRILREQVILLRQLLKQAAPTLDNDPIPPENLPSVSHLLSQNKKLEQALKLHPLSRRERQVMQLVAAGQTTREIADTLYLSPNTVENHRRKAMRKVGAKNTAELVRYALEAGLSNGHLPE